jgi:hypothetical protein
MSKDCIQYVVRKEKFFKIILTESKSYGNL